MEGKTTEMDDDKFAKLCQERAIASAPQYSALWAVAYAIMKLASARPAPQPEKGPKCYD